MWIDSTLEFCDDVAVDTNGTATKVLGTNVDLGTSRDIGQGHPMYLVIQVTEAFGGGTSTQFVLASDSTDTLAADGNETRHITTDVFTIAQLTAGFSMVIPLPMGDTVQGEDAIGYEQFLGMETIQVGTMNAGKVDIFLTNDPHGWVSYPDGNN